MIYIRKISRLILSIPLMVIELFATYTLHFSAKLREKLYEQYVYDTWIKRDLQDCETVLELGCGSGSPVLRAGYGPKTTAMEIYPSYVAQHNAKKDYKICFVNDILKWQYPAKQYDAVVAFDVLEHLDKQAIDNFDLFDKMERCARKKVILFTPNGFTENDEVDGDPYQKHKSAWEPSDFTKRGYTVVGATGSRRLLGESALPKYKPMRAWWLLSIITQPFVYDKPMMAFHSYAVKQIKQQKGDK